MKLFARWVVALAAGVSGFNVAHARPVIIEESAVLAPPSEIFYEYSGADVGTNGEYAIMSAARTQGPDQWRAQTFDALLYRRVNGNWVFQRILATGSREEEDYSSFPVLVGMKDNVASAALGGNQYIFRYNGTDWVPAGFPPALHEDVSIDGDNALFGVGEQWDGVVIEPDGNGGWNRMRLPGQPRGYDDEFWGGPVDLLGDRAILGTPYTFDLEPQEIPIYRRTAPFQWQLLTKLQVPTGEYRLDSEVALHVNNAIVNGRSGGFVWANANFYGQPNARLQAVNAYSSKATHYKLAKDGNLIAASAFDPDLNTIVVNVFRWDETAARYSHVAILKPSAGSTLNGNIEIDGNIVIAGSNPRAFVFELPATFPDPQARFENFESGNSANWTRGAGSQFSIFRRSAVNNVFRQISVTGDAHAVLGGTNAVHQGVEADIIPWAFGCADCWVGVATRYVDARNYYYVTLRHSGSVHLKRMRNGVFDTLASATLPVPLHRTFRLRLDSMGHRHRVYVDGKLLMSADDSGPLTAGNAAIIMYKAKADYDNVAVSPTPRGELFAYDFAGESNGFRGDWSHSGPGQWNKVDGVFKQTSVAAEARALIGTPTEDQSVAFRVRPTAFASTSTGEERWVGAIARHRDDRNYYYLTLRTGGTLSLRKLVNGVITPIRDVPATMTQGSWHSLRLEATGTTLRGYLNGALLIQVTDTTHSSGRTGVMTWRTAADFDNYLAYQP